MIKILARKKEVQLLDGIYAAKEPAFVLVYGRRHIGQQNTPVLEYEKGLLLSDYV